MSGAPWRALAHGSDEMTATTFNGNCAACSRKIEDTPTPFCSPKCARNYMPATPVPLEERVAAIEKRLDAMDEAKRGPMQPRSKRRT